jgi:N-acetylmuramoyl-L-alanine amidase
VKGIVANVKPPDTLSIRDKASMRGKIIGHIPNGAGLEVLSTGKEWHLVEYGGVKGYSWGGYIKIESTTPPPQPARARTIVLDPGHFHNHNKGAVEGYWEGNVMLDYALVLKPELEALGWKTILTRADGRNIGLAARSKVAVKNKADLFYSLHSNACSTPSVRRVTAFYSVDRPDDKDFTLAQAKTVAGVMGSPSFHAQVRASTVYHSKPDPSTLEDYYTVIDAASDGGVPHVLLLEHDFHTNPDVCRFLMNRDNLVRLAKAEAACIDEHIR